MGGTEENKESSQWTSTIKTGTLEKYTAAAVVFHQQGAHALYKQLVCKKEPTGH